MAKLIAKVFEQNQQIEGGFVELTDGISTYRGIVASVGENNFVVDWQDNVRTVEDKSNYELVVEASSKEANFPIAENWSDVLGIATTFGLGAFGAKLVEHFKKMRAKHEEHANRLDDHHGILTELMDRIGKLEGKSEQ